MHSRSIGMVSGKVGMEIAERTARTSRDVVLSTRRSPGEDCLATCCDIAGCPYLNSGDATNPGGTDAQFPGNGSGHKGNRRQAREVMGGPALWKNEALEEMQKEQAEAMVVLVHELRSPTIASKSLAATLRYLNPEDSQLQFVLGRIETRMDQLLSLVDDIVHLSSVKAGHPLGEPVVLNLVAASRTVCEPYLEEASAKGLAMTLDLPDSAVWVHMAEQAFRLILSNLVSNAVKYTPAGSVRVTLRQEEAWAVLEVKDSGIGIPSDEISRLFTEFFRASNARRGRYPGTGLGLTGVKALVERCGGELEMASEEKVGSRFTVRLPLCSENAA
jgi:signal transduction histidine kinase